MVVVDRASLKTAEILDGIFGWIKDNDKEQQFYEENESDRLELLYKAWRAGLLLEMFSLSLIDEDSEEMQYQLEEIWGVMQEFAPAYCTFGAHEGNASCFGFWPVMEQVQEDIRNGEIVVSDDPSEAPAVVFISDHGNVTYYENGEEIWSIV